MKLSDETLSLACERLRAPLKRFLAQSFEHIDFINFTVRTVTFSVYREHLLNDFEQYLQNVVWMFASRKISMLDTSVILSQLPLASLRKEIRLFQKKHAEAILRREVILADELLDTQDAMLLTSSSAAPVKSKRARFSDEVLSPRLQHGKFFLKKSFDPDRGLVVLCVNTLRSTIV